MNYIKYKSLYLDFLEDSKILPDQVKTFLRRKLESEENEQIAFKTLIFINTIINKNMPVSASKQRIQRLKCYDQNYVDYLLDYQEKFELTDTQLALKFKLSRNTVAQWKKNR